MAITKVWALVRNRFGRRFKQLELSNAMSLVSSNALGKKLNTYFEKKPIEPQCTVVPTVSGSPVVGQVLTGTDGTWVGTPTPTLTYQWQSSATLDGGFANIAGATAKTYTLVAGDVDRYVRIVVRGTNINGIGYGDAVAKGPVTATELEAGGSVLFKPANVDMPSIHGDPIVGSTLTCDPGIWNGDPVPTFTYQWKVDSVAVEGMTDEVLVVDAADVGKTITCTVVAANSEGTSQRTTAGVTAVAAA